MNRREFVLLPVLMQAAGPKFDIVSIERARVLRPANLYLTEAPVTVTAAHSPRSVGGEHDYFSEGDYWWPDSKNPGGPYIQRDGIGAWDEVDCEA